MRTKFPQEIDGASPSRTLSAQNFLEFSDAGLRFPRTVKHRHVRVKIYRKTTRYPFYRIAYRAEGHRVVRSFKTYGEAHAAAKAAARLIASGKDGAATLSTAEVHAVKFARRKLNELSIDLNLARTDTAAPEISLSLEDAIAEYAEAKRAFGSGRLIEAVKAFLANVAQVRRISIRQAVDEYLAGRERQTIPREAGKRAALSPKLHYQDKLRLERFATAFDQSVCDLTRDHLTLFFQQHLGKLSPRSRNHYRVTVRQWLKFCLSRDYLPTNHRLAETPALKNEKTDRGEVAIYTAKEFESLLAAAQGPLKVLLAVGGFAGLRTQELLRLEWEDLWRRPGFIEVGQAKAKTRQRRLVPICAALADWLAPWRQTTSGLVWSGSELNFHVGLREVASTAGVERRDNALRHSYISYRLAQAQNEHQVAQEAGTSPAMIHTHYRELVTPDEAREWFAVMPPTTDGAAPSEPTTAVTAP